MEFIDDMVVVYVWVDVVVCCFGVLMVSEIVVVGLLVIFVLFQYKDRQQYWNVLLLENVGVVKIFEQLQFIVEVVVDILVGWLCEVLLIMVECVCVVFILDVIECVVSEVSWVVWI